LSRTVPVVMPDEVWGRLVSVAEDRHTTVSVLLASAVKRIVDPPKFKRGPAGSDLQRDRLSVIVPLREAGWTWAQISGRTGIPHGSLMLLASKHGLTNRKS
jgi:hypothetical protein